MMKIYDENQILIASPTLRSMPTYDVEYFSRRKDSGEKIQHDFPLLDSLETLAAFV